MLRLALGVLTAATFSVAANAQSNENTSPDTSTMSPEAHAPLFRGAKPIDAGVVTDRLTSAMPAAGSSGPMALKNFVDQSVFGKMEHDGIPHAPLATDQEFLRRVMLDLTGRIPTPSD